MENSHRSSAVVPLVALPAVFSGLNVSSTDDRATRWNMETQTGLSAGDRVDAGLAEPLSCRSKGTLCQATVDMESRSIPPSVLCQCFTPCIQPTVEARTFGRGSDKRRRRKTNAKFSKIFTTKKCFINLSPSHTVNGCSVYFRGS